MGTTIPLQIKLISQLLVVSTRNTSRSNVNLPRMQDQPGGVDSRPPDTLETMQANTNEVEALRLTNQRLIEELKQLTRQIQRPREARQTQEGRNVTPYEGQHNLGTPRGGETEAESSRAKGHDLHLTPGEEGNEATLGGHVGNEELRHPQQGVGERSWEQRFKSLQQELSRVKEVVRGRATDSINTLVQQTKSPFTAEVLHFPLPAKFRMPQVEAFDGAGDPVDHINTYKNQMELHGYQDLYDTGLSLSRYKAQPWLSLTGFRPHQSPHLKSYPLHLSPTSLELEHTKSKLSFDDHQAKLARKPEVLCSEVQCRVSEGGYTRRKVCDHRIHRWARSAAKRFDVFHLKKPPGKHG